MSMLKAKKWAASKLGDTKLGRAKAVKMIGEEGYQIVNAIDEVTLKFSGKDVAKTMSKHIAKILMKTSVLWNEKVLKPEDAAPLREPVLELARTLQQMLDSRPGSLDPTSMCTAIKNTYDAVLPILTPHMAEKSWSRLTVLSGFYGSPEFQTVFLNDPRMAEERATIKEQLDSLLSTHDPRAAPLICSINGCLLPRLAVKGTLYCLGHHALKYSEPPTLADFLKNVEHQKLFVSFLRTSMREKYPLLEFWNKVDDFKTLRNKSVIATRGNALYHRYLSAEAKVPVVTDPTILEKLERELETPRASMFTAAQAAVFEDLERIFNGPFMASPQYKEFADENLGYEVPPMNADRLAELAMAGIEITLPASVSVSAGGSAGGSAAGAGGASGAGVGAGGASGAGVGAGAAAGAGVGAGAAAGAGAGASPPDSGSSGAAGAP